MQGSGGGHLFRLFVQLCCGERGTPQTTITGVCGQCSQHLGHTGFAPTHGVCAFPVYTAQAPGCSAGELSKRGALVCVHFPGLTHSGSGSRVLHKGTDSVGPAFCVLPRSEWLRCPGAWRVHSPQVGDTSYQLPGPSCWVSWVHHKNAVSGVPCISSGELISDRDPPGGCQPSRIPGRLG